MVLGLAMLPAAGTASAQDGASASMMLQGASTGIAPLVPADTFASEQAPSARNRWKGAGLGVVIGALVGGVGFAVFDYTTTNSLPKSEYTALAFLVGAAVGGVVGGVLGALVGVPERPRARSASPLLQVSPRRPGASLGVSMPLPF